jgi:hypothetical protein
MVEMRCQHIARSSSPFIQHSGSAFSGVLEIL